MAYGDVRVLHDVSLRVGQGQIVSLVGANGAGKTTTLRAVSGLLPVLEGAVKFDGEPITGLAPSRIVERGLAHVPEGRHLFTNMTVHENLEMGAYLPRAKGSMAETMAWVTGLFPRLAERRTQLAGTLSGG
ncbi:MAG: branched-chain amino acid ABC transporter ATP-binding protein, partial [Candidatus Rokuibacteriota bacterium]